MSLKKVDQAIKYLIDSVLCVVKKLPHLDLANKKKAVKADKHWVFFDSLGLLRIEKKI